MPTILLATQIRRALRDSPRSGTEFEALGGVAVHLAKIVDGSDDERVQLTALGRLEGVLVRLGIGSAGEPAGPGPAVPGDGAGSGDELGSLMGSGPVGGNGKDA